MTLDDLIEAFLLYAAVNHPDREPEEMRLQFKDGKKIVALVPADQTEQGHQRHDVEKCILKLLSGGKTMLYKNLKKAVTQQVKCSERTVDRYLRRLKDDEAIEVVDDEYRIPKRDSLLG